MASREENQLRSAVADAWVRDALAEHASVASFARCMLELMSVGAPPQLLSAAALAANDEVRPGPLPSISNFSAGNTRPIVLCTGSQVWFDCLWSGRAGCQSCWRTVDRSDPHRKSSGY